MEWSTITASALKTWRKRYDLETAAGRLGAKEFYNQRAMQVKRSAPTAPLYMWSLDGWDAELYYQKTTTRKGKTVTTYSNRLTVVVVLDVFNKYPIRICYRRTGVRGAYHRSPAQRRQPHPRTVRRTLPRAANPKRPLRDESDDADLRRERRQGNARACRQRQSEAYRTLFPHP